MDKRKIKSAPAPGKQPKPRIVYGCAGAHPHPMPVADAVGALKVAADLANKLQSPDKKFKLPKISEKEVAELTQAAQFAFGNDEADKWFDDVMALARAKEKRWLARGEQNKTNKPI